VWNHHDDPPVVAIAAAGAIAFPGPILGVISYAIILVLGIVRAVGLRRTKDYPSESDISITDSTFEGRLGWLTYLLGRVWRRIFRTFISESNIAPSM
jgi:hypothetical protein